MEIFLDLLLLTLSEYPTDSCILLVSSFFLLSFFFWQHFRDLYLQHVLTDFNHYYVLRIFHPILYCATLETNNYYFGYLTPKWNWLTNNIFWHLDTSVSHCIIIPYITMLKLGIFLEVSINVEETISKHSKWYYWWFWLSISVFHAFLYYLKILIFGQKYYFWVVPANFSGSQCFFGSKLFCTEWNDVMVFAFKDLV